MSSMNTPPPVINLASSNRFIGRPK